VNGRAWVCCLGLLVVVWAGWAAHAQAPATKPAAAPAAVATVGSRRVARDEYDRRLAAAEQQLAARAGQSPAEFQDLLRRQMLETLIRLNLLVLESQRLGMTVSAAAAESVLQRDAFFSPNGQFDAQRWQLTRASQPERFEGALQLAREQLAARRLDEQLQVRFRPEDAVLRERALRQLRRAVTEDLSLHVEEFSGNYPEPRELDVLRHYREHPAEFRRTDRAKLSVVQVNEPPRTQLEERDAAAGAAWTARMKRAADSLITAVRGGARLEDASAAYGGPRPDVTVLADNFPGYWRGDAGQTAAVFKAAPGTLLREPVPASDGFLVVRVDEVVPSHVAPLAEVAREIRGRLRDDSRLHHEENELRALYATLRDSLSGPAWRFRWAALDTATVRVAEPTDADLDRWYRGHLADFSSFDATSGTIVAKPLAQVRDEVRARWKRDRRLETARVQSDELYQAWSAGKRAPALESAARVKETAPAPMGADIDSGFAAAALSDTLWKRGEPRGAGLAPYARGYLVWQVIGRVASHTPTFEQVSPALRVALEARQQAVEDAGARRLFDQDPKRFGSGKRFLFTRMTVPIPPIEGIKLTRAEVERWHRQHLDKYSAQELVRASHILISPINATPAADRAARVRADSLLARIRAGESFDALAARFSDDPATKDKGGDLGVFARGTMLQAFEDAVFAMQEGDLGGPVKTEVGYHIIRCTEHAPAFVQPLKLVYSIVASDCARAKGDTLALQRADSLVRVLHTAAQGRTAARRLGFVTTEYQFGVDELNPNTDLVPYFERMFTMKAGEVMPFKWRMKGAGYWITWVDSIAPPIEPRWEDARERAVEAYRVGAGERAMMAKVAELDSLAAAGWSFDSLGTLWGGLTRSKELSAVGADQRAGLPVSLDSLVFGLSGRPPALAPGQVSGWVRWPGGMARVRLLERREPPADRVRVRCDELRRIAVERRMQGYFDDLRKRYPVRILDKKLAAIPLPELPAEE
jgi:parvulin-like peptidyl-prolyl isomerase